MSGCQGESWVTPDKQDGFRKYQALHAHVVKMVTRGWNKPYFYVDLEAGCGYNYKSEVEGSPLLFLKNMADMAMPYKAFLVEKDEDRFKELRSRVGHDTNVTVYHCDNKDVVWSLVEKIPKNAYGLVYSDPNGIPQFQLLAPLAASRPKLDILIRCPCCAIKRNHGNLSEMLQKVNKANWIIRRRLQSDAWQWTFLFGNNFPGGFLEWRSEGFYSIASEEGREILLELEMTHDEVARVQKTEADAHAEVMRRSGGVCERCHKRQATEVHHLSYPSIPTASALMHVCHHCHCVVEKKAT